MRVEEGKRVTTCRWPERHGGAPPVGQWCIGGYVGGYLITGEEVYGNSGVVPLHFARLVEEIRRIYAY